ncbi:MULTISPECIES: hypothetical protein [unclassified Microcoleus]|uniref:hypothetical protein n=2 Tax=Microcoleus TaxID=44471 RepID=UPI0025FDDF99|nr:MULTISPECIES: hypothetical protein [unclassified Microcoleus]
MGNLRLKSIPGFDKSKSEAARKRKAEGKKNFEGNNLSFSSSAMSNSVFGKIYFCFLHSSNYLSRQVKILPPTDGIGSNSKLKAGSSLTTAQIREILFTLVHFHLDYLEF